jgi:hypothetical protein
MKLTTAICVALVLAGSAAFGQTENTEVAAPEKHSFTSLHGHEVLPQKGDWAMGISATGFLGYLGNMMNSSTVSTPPSFNTGNTPNAFAIGNLSGMAIMGKYMKSATMAYRVRFQANAGNTMYRNNVLKSLPTPDPLNPIFVEDDLNVSSYVVLLGAGFEKRRGSGRLQGFWGAEALVGMAGNKRAVSYGNSLSLDFPAPLSTTDFGNGISSFQASRLKESSTGNTMLFGARAFAGVEYFFAPRISLGGEIGYTLGFSTNNEGYVTNEYWNPTTSTKGTVTTKTFSNSGMRSFGAGLDNVNAGINLHFYF